MKSEGMIDMVPKDPVILLSYVNSKLRDHAKDIETLCDLVEIDRQELEERLAGMNYHYNREKNQFV
ncbi:MAG TPA: DUF4250 domain-containing protein [Lachnospiraceae bacterium]|nr:DUF4250 domain-containing protein [Lachnospiraceae bacterium]